MVTPDRINETTARRTLALLVPDLKARDLCTEFLVRSIATAHSLAPDRWGVTLTSRYVRLNVGMLELFSIRKVNFVTKNNKPVNRLVEVTFEIQSLSAKIWKMRGVHEGKLGWQVSVEAADGLFIELPSLARVLPLIEPSHRRAIQLAAETKRHPMTVTGHSPNLVRFLAARHGVELAQPDYCLSSYP